MQENQDFTSQQLQTENKIKQQQTIQKFLDQYNILQKENQKLQDKNEKLEKDMKREIQKEKDSKEKISQENQKLSKTIKDLKQELQQYAQKLQLKENEISDVQKRLDQKFNIDDKNKERDSLMFQKFLGRKAISTNSQDQKLLTILNHYENQQEKHQNQIENLKKQNQSFIQKDQEFQSHQSSLQKGEKLQMQQLQKNCHDLSERIQQIELEKFNIQKQYSEINKINETLQKQNKNLLKNNDSLQDKCKTLQKEISSNYVLNVNTQKLQYPYQSQEHEINSQQQQQLSQSQKQPFQDQTNFYVNVSEVQMNNPFLHNNEISDQKNEYQENQIKNKHQKHMNNNNNSETPLDDYNKQTISFSHANNIEHQNYSKVQNVVLETTELEISADNNNDIYEKIMKQMMEIYQISDCNNLVKAAKKMEQVMKAIPRLEQLIKSICQLVFPQQENYQENIENLIPTLQQWQQDSVYIEQFIEFKNRLIQILNFQIINTDHYNITDKDIINKITSYQKQIKDQTEQIQNFNNQQESYIQKIKQQDQVIQTIGKIKNLTQIQEIMALFGLFDNEENEQDVNVQKKMNQIFIQLNDIQKFIKFAKKIMDLDEEMREEAVLSYIIKVLEKMKMGKYNDADLILKIMKILKLEDPAQIIQKLESIVLKKK